jgi:hypothetical protein
MNKLNEAVNYQLKDLADSSWTEHGEDLDKDTHDAVRNAFGAKGNHAIIDVHGQEAQPDIDVKEHLEKHGYQIHDYKKGIARIEKQVGNPAMGIPMRSKEVHESIGKVLEKTSAPNHVKNAFANDESRQSSKSHGLKVLISTHPYAIFGKTSGTRWSNESCMNAETGSNREFLNKDMAHATHEAFLVHPDDDCITKGDAWPSNPIARVSLKRHVGEDDDTGEEHSIYRAGGSTYGAGNSDFHRAVNNWAMKNYPGKRGTTYSLHDDLYSEGTTTYHNPTKEDLDKIHTGNNRQNYTLNAPDTHHAINKAFESTVGGKLPRDVAVNLGIGITNMDTHNVNRIINESDDPTHVAGGLAHQHGEKFSTNNIERYRANLARTGATSYKSNILSNKKLPDHIIDTLAEDDIARVPVNRLKEHHVDKLVNGYINGKSGSSYWLRDVRKALTSNHIDKLIDHGINSRRDIHGSAMTSNNFTQAHADKIADKRHSIAHMNIIYHLGLSPYVSPDSVEVVEHATSVLHNTSPHVEDAQKVAKDVLVHNATNKNNNFGRSNSPARIPKSILEHTNDDEFKTLMNNGRFANTQSKAIVNKVLDLHRDDIDHELTKFGKKYEGEESPKDHPDFENDVDNLHTKIYDHQATLEKHAEDHGDEDELNDHMENYENMISKHTGIANHVSMDLETHDIRRALQRREPD